MSEDVRKRVVEIISKQLEIEPQNIKPEASFTDDLKADSLAVVELVLALEEELGVDDEGRTAFARFGGRLGLAFQIADDVLDATGTAEDLGKSPGKDAASHKLTWVTLFGLDATRAKLAELERELVDLASDIDGASGGLAELARFVCRRRS